MGDMSIPTSTGVSPQRRGGWFARWGRELAVLAAGIPMSALSFTLIFTGLVTGAVTTMVWIGLPILSVTALVARGLADAERASCAWAWGSLPAHAYRPDAGWFDRLRDPQSWRDIVHAVVGCWIQLVTSLVGLIWTVVALGMSSYALWEWSLPHGDVQGLYDLITGDASRTGDVVFTTVIGLVGLLLAPAVVHGAFGVRYVVALALLTNPSAILRAQATEAVQARRDAVRAESHTLSMIERSIHDGPQQRLVRLQMDLESARRRLQADDPAAAGDLLDQALGQSREVLQELRAVSRGIAPPVLRERGLLAAVTAAAARNPVDTVVDTDLDPRERWGEELEATAYFVVTEALTNVAKHSGADQACVTLVTHQGHLGLRLEDDGRGGAHVGKGHGLAGLEARLASVGGRLQVDSPAGGPTVVTASIPLGANGGRDAGGHR